jgi:hypothetical protein
METQSQKEDYGEFTSELRLLIESQIEKAMTLNSKVVVTQIVKALDPIIDEKINKEMKRLTESIKKSLLSN